MRIALFMDAAFSKEGFMKKTLARVFILVVGVALASMMAQCKAGQLPFGEELKLENALPPPAEPGAATLEATTENVEAQIPPLVVHVPAELNLESQPTALLTHLPDDSEPTVLFCLDGRKTFAAKFVVDLMKTPTITKLLEKLESKVDFNVESPYLWNFACSPLADKDCGQKLLFVKPLEAVATDKVEAPPFKMLPFDTAGLERLTFAGFDSYKRDDTLFAVRDGRLFVMNTESLTKAVMEKFERLDTVFPAIPDDSIAILIAKPPLKALQKLDFFKADLATAAPAQRMVALFKIPSDNNPVLDIKYYVDGNVVGATLVRLNSAYFDWEKFFDTFKSEDSKDIKTDVDSANKPMSNFKAQ